MFMDSEFQALVHKAWGRGLFPNKAHLPGPKPNTLKWDVQMAASFVQGRCSC